VGLTLVTVVILVIGMLVGSATIDRPIVAASVRDILATPQQYLGQRVVVSGRVDELLTHRALTLGSDLSVGSLPVLIETSALVNGDDLGGVVPLGHGQIYQEQDFVQFLGTVETFDRESLGTRLDIVLNEDLFGDLEGQPVLLVERLDVAALGAVPTEPTPSATLPSGVGPSPASSSGG